MTPDEKRFFKTNARQFIREAQTNNHVLFDMIDAQKVYDEAAIKARLGAQWSGNQFAVAKNYLYKSVLKAMAAYTGERGALQKIREGMRTLEVLFHKELYVHCAQHMAKLKALAEALDHPAVHLEVLNWERRLWNKRFFQDTTEADLDQHVGAVMDRYERYGVQLTLQNLHTRFFYHLRTKGYFHSRATFLDLNADLLAHPLLAEGAATGSVGASIFHHHVRGLSHLMSGESAQANSELGQLITLIDETPDLAYDNFELYVSLVYNYGTTCLQLDRYEDLGLCILKLERLKVSFAAQRARLYYFLVLLKTEYLLGVGRFDDLLAFATESLYKLDLFDAQLTVAEHVSVSFSIAYVHFAHGRYRDCHHILHAHMRPEQLGKNPEFHVAVGMLTLVLYYEMEEEELFVRAFRALSRQLLKHRPRFGLEMALLRTIRKASHMLKGDATQFFRAMRTQIDFLRQDPAHARAMQHFNFDIWLAAKIEGVGLLDIVHRMVK